MFKFMRLKASPTLAIAFALGCAVSLHSGSTLAGDFTISYEAPGVQVVTGVTATVIGTETFNTLSTTSQSGGTSFSTDFGTGNVITGNYSGVFGILPADQYGGAGNTGNYIATFSSSGYTVTLSNTVAIPGVNYFGFWLSALDSGNQLTFLENGTVVGTFTPSDLIAAIGLNQAYFGNPADNGSDSNQPFVFVNFYDTAGYFNEIHYAEIPVGAGYESDNHTVGFVTAVGGTVLSSGNTVPEPASILLFGIAGGALAGLRHRRKLL